jgi:Protein of unknown function (DUF3800)
MSVRCYYVDESYDAEKFCLSAIGIRHNQWQECFRRVQQHRRLLKEDFGIFIRKEIHAHQLVGGRGQISDRVIHKHARSRIFHGLLRLVAELPEVMLFNICLDVKGRRDPQLDAWDRLLNRIERTMLAFEQRELPLRKKILSELPAAMSAPGGSLHTRLLNYAPRALIFADEGRQIEITRVCRKMTVFNPIPSQFGAWSEGATKNLPLQRIIEDPVFKQSHQSFFIQLADCVSFALLKRETIPTPNIKKYGINEFFNECLSSVCFKSAAPRDPNGIVRK